MTRALPLLTTLMEAAVFMGRTAGFLFFILALVGGVTVLSAAAGGL